MSMNLTELIAPDGSKIYIQYSGGENDELQAVGFFEPAADITQRTKNFTQTMTSTIRGYSSLILTAIKESMVNQLTPEKVTLEFGLQIGGEAGVPFVTKGTAQANVKVAIEWSTREA